MQRANTITVLYIEDNVFHRQEFTRALQAWNENGFAFAVQTAESFADIERQLLEKYPDIIVSDLDLGQGLASGITQLQAMQKKAPNSCWIVRSQSDDSATLRTVIGGGVDDFISKRSDKLELPLRLWKALELKRSLLPASSFMQQIAVGKSMASVAARIPNISQSAISTVHVLGETGTGKEVVADLFASTLEKTIPFVRVNCAAIAPSVMESELFGHTKGSFTGAQNDRIGFFEAANGGWIFLDELAALSKNIQAAVLRVIENGEVTRVGSSTPRKIRVRVLSASNIPIAELVAKGEFRQDLWQRLSETVLNLPALRDRKEEIPLLIEHFLRTTSGGPYQMTEPAMTILSGLDWKLGNIRQLRNTIRAMTEYAVCKTLTPLGIPRQLLDEYSTSSQDVIKSSGGIDSTVENQTLDFETRSLQLFWDLLRQAAEQNHEPLSVRAAAKSLNMSRSAVSDRIDALTKLGWVSADDLRSICKS